VGAAPAARCSEFLDRAHGYAFFDEAVRGGGHDMWKRDEAVKPASGQPAPTPAAPSAPSQQASTQAVPQTDVRRQIERDVVNIGKSVVIKGELNGSEDLTIEGHVEGKIELKDHVLTIGPNGKIKAAVFAKSVIVLGEVNGNVTASEKVDIRDGGAVDGDIVSPRVAIAEGAHFRGTVDMQKKGGQPSQQKPSAQGTSQPQQPVQQVAQPVGR
jgi:cytoskeletal protein CcmA (bactofilin family)